MLVSVELDADFSRGCVGRSIGHLLFKTHPHLGIREQPLRKAPKVSFIGTGPFRTVGTQL